jgi:hypothetical protein
VKQTPDDDELTPLAEAISDGEPVNWEVETANRPHLEQLVRELRVLETLAALHRPAPDAGQGPALPEGPEGPSPQTMGKWGSLVLLEKLGQGGFGAVYRAFDPALQRAVALKLVREDRLLRPEATAEFLEEARRLARVRHPNVVIVHGVDRHDGAIGIWSDLIVGRTLEELLEQRGPFSASEASQVGIELCGALAAVHAAGLVHRDVKTTNVMREQGGRLVLMDFGAASETLESGPWPAHGTEPCTAPEVIRGEPALPCADLYSLGVLLYRLTTGRHPYTASTLGELRESQESGRRVPLRTLRPDLPAGFVQVVETALESDPRRRFADAASMEHALLALVAGGRRIGRRGWIAGVLLVVAAISLVLVLWPTPKSAPRLQPSKAAPGSADGSRPGAPAPAISAVATLYRERQGEDTPLAPGDRVAPGDALYMDLASSEPVFVYVLSADEHGETFVLFPASGLDLVNPLVGGTRHRLPGTRAGNAFDWQVTSAGGSETVMVVASRARMPELERKLHDLETAQPDRPVAYGGTDTSAGDVTGDIMRGIGGMRASALPSQDAGGRRLARLLSGALPAGGDAPWVWSIRLGNSGHE